MDYRKRFVDREIGELLKVFGGVVIEGIRGCGKTTTATHHAASVLRLDESPSLSEFAQLNPLGALEGDTPRLIDEWQLSPNIWNQARHEIDARKSPGQFIFSGSAKPADDITRHTGVGRFASIHLGTMSLAESGRSSRQIGFKDLLDYPSYRSKREALVGKNPLTYNDLAKQAVIGGWPALLGASVADGRRFNREYLRNTLRNVPTLVDREPNRQNMERLVASLSRNIASEVTYRTFALDIGAGQTPVDPQTVKTYLDDLQQIFVYEPQPAWSVELRSKARLRTQVKHHFAEPALALAALGADWERLSRNPEFFGQVFESMVIRDLRAFAAGLDGKVYHYRDSSGLEVDAIVELPDIGWAGVEVKLGSGGVEAAERSLLKLAETQVDTDKVGEPKALMVVTGTEYAYQLASGVLVIPLGVLDI